MKNGGGQASAIRSPIKFPYGVVVAVLVGVATAVAVDLVPTSGSA